jgi:hypothetical protein
VEFSPVRPRRVIRTEKGPWSRTPTCSYKSQKASG